MPEEQERDELDEAFEAEDWFTVRAITDRRLEQEPTDFYARVLQAKALSRMCLHDEARRELHRLWRRTCSAKRPEASALIAVELGRLYKTKGSFTRAEIWYQRAIDAAPEDAGNYIFLASLYRRWGRFEDAERKFRQGAECAEGSPDEAMANLGTLLASQGKFAEGLELLDRAFAIDPEYEWAINMRADITRAFEITGECD